MKDQLHDYMARPKRYDNIDGTGEMYMGFMLLGFALIGYVQAGLSEHSVWRSNRFGMLGLMYGILIPVLGIGFLLQRLVKKRLTWPRTGYVALGVPDAAHAAPGSPAGWKIRWKFKFRIACFAGVLGVVFGALIALLLVFGATHPGAISLARIGYSAFWLPIYAFWIFHMGREHRWKWLILALMALGLILLNLLVSGGFNEFLPPVFLFVGLVWFGSGAATLLVYLRHHRLPAADEL